MMIFLMGCISGGRVEGMGETSFVTEDGYTIYADYLEGGEKAVLLIHMLSRDKSSWGDFAGGLNQKGYTVLAIDMRGHGKSVMKGGQKRTWQSFSEQEFNDIVADVAASKEFLKGKGKEMKFIIGASIGANIALNYGAQQGIAGVALLSPGLDYRGVKTEEAMSKYTGKILLMASVEDKPAEEAVNKLPSLTKLPVSVDFYNGLGHGTEMLKDTRVKERIIEWLSTGM